MNQRELYKKIIGMTKENMKRIGLTQKDCDFIAIKIKKHSLGLQLNFTEIDENLSKNYFIFKENKKLGINVKNNGANNLLIEGDNYYALNSLKVAGQKVDVIYIDPPYNTGKEFIYNDDFSTGKAKVVGDDDPHRHSKWLSFMKKRLKIAKELLNDDGVIFVSIDDHEQAYLKVLMDEIFGENNFVNQLVWISKKAGRQISNSAFAKTYEYILMYSKKQIISSNIFNIDRKWAQKNMPCIYSSKNSNISLYKDDKGEFRYDSELQNTNIKEFNIETRKNLFFPIFTDGINISLEPKKGWSKLLPPKNQKGIQGVWRWSKEKVKNEYYNLHIIKKNNKYKIYTKIRHFTYIPKDIILSSSMTTRSGNSEMDALNITNFNFPKPTKLIKFLLKHKKNAVILDFFAGSGTAGQAVMELNKEDGGNRRFILVTNNENDIARKITRERLFRVINGKGSNGEEIKWMYDKTNNIKSLANNSVKYLELEEVHKVNGEFEQIDSKKELYINEFNKNISIEDFE